ncbi:MAG: hypothetical protein RR585_02940 [Coprobacillus sp.]
MKKTFEFEEDFEASVEQVWNTLIKPSQIVMEKITAYTNTDDLNWQEAPSNGVYNEYHATLDESTRTVHIVTHNSKWDSESNDIVMKVTSIDDSHCHVHVSYQIGTTAIFNIIAIELAGEKLAHHASHTIFKNIKKRL